LKAEKKRDDEKQKKIASFISEFAFYSFAAEQFSFYPRLEKTQRAEEGNNKNNDEKHYIKNFARGK
jgi:hypothetical protein